jgi:hypothetical protein
VGLYNRPEVVSQIVSTAPLGINETATMMERTFRSMTETRS